MPTIGLVFFLARACQHKTSKIGMTIVCTSLAQDMHFKGGNKFKSTYLAQFNSLEKYPKQ